MDQAVKDFRQGVGFMKRLNPTYGYGSFVIPEISDRESMKAGHHGCRIESGMTAKMRPDK